MSFVFLIYILGSAAAIGLIALLIHRLGHSAPHRFADEDAARAEFLAEFPDEKIAEAGLSADRTAALLRLAGEGQFGITRAMGRFTLTRPFGRAEIVRVQRNKAALRVYMRDYTDPGFAVEFSDETEARRWHGMLTPQMDVPS